MANQIIAIDGPAASGKGTLAKSLAKKLNFAFLDTGALYRMVAFTVLERWQDPDNKDDAVEAAEFCRDFFDASILENKDLRSDEIGSAASKLATYPGVRKALLELQRNFAANPPEGLTGAVLDGRDIGTVICPDAPLKLYITAKTEIRAERRLKELQSRGIKATYGAVLKDMRERDTRDAARKDAPMKPADDAIVIDSSHLSPAEMLDKALGLAKERFSL